MQPLRDRALRAMGWTLSGQVAAQVVRLAVMIALSRLLDPADFGLVAMVATITGFIAVFTEAGIMGALIHRKELTRPQIAGAAWLSLTLGIVLTIVTMAMSPLVAALYHRQALEALTIGLAVDFLVSAPGLVPSALLSRSMRFRRVVGAELGGLAVAGALAITQAALRPSAWPIVTFVVVSDLVTSALLVAASPYPVAAVPDRAALRDLWAFSGGLMGDTVVNYWSRNADNLLIGRVLGSAALGIYSRCYVILLFPVQQVTEVVNRVMFPAMATVQDDLSRIRSAYLRTVSVVAVVMLPAAALILVAAQPIVVGLLGPKWSDAVPILRVFAGVAAIQSIGTTTGWLYQVTGHTARMFRVTVVLTILVIAGFVIGVQWGLMGVAYSYLLWNCVSLPVNVVYSGRAVGVRLLDVVSECATPFVLAVALLGALSVMAAATTAAAEGLRLVVLVVSAVVIYVGELMVVRPPAWRRLRSAVSDLRRSVPAAA
jgi:PST family polysaccharide transporter